MKNGRPQVKDLDDLLALLEIVTGPLSCHRLKASGWPVRVVQRKFQQLQDRGLIDVSLFWTSPHLTRAGKRRLEQLVPNAGVAVPDPLTPVPWCHRS
jgi:hypothetical protein